MINRCIIFFAFLPALVKAQQKLPDSLEVKAKMVIEAFGNSTLGINSGAIDLTKYNQFKNLFDANAIVEDDLNAIFQYSPDSANRKYIIKNIPKPFDIYAHNAALQLSSVSFVNDSDWGIKKIEPLTYSIIRQVTITKARKYVLPGNYAEQVVDGRKDIDFVESNRLNVIASLKSSIPAVALYSFSYKDTLNITLVLKGDGTFKIVHVESSLGEIVCSNDTDNDAVVNGEDDLHGTAGDFTAGGRPDYDLDGVPDMVKGDTSKFLITDKCKKIYGEAANQGCPLDYFLTKRSFDGFTGLQLNSAKINLPELNQLGYVDEMGNNAMDVNQSKKGSLNNPGFRPGIHAGVNFSYYFGRDARKLGVSMGAAFSAFFADYQLSDSVIMYTFKANDSEHDYRRRVTIDSLNESIRYSIFNFPIMLSFRSYIGKQRKSVINIKAGPSLMVFNTTSEYDAYISVEGLYQTGNNGIIYEDNFDPNSDRNVFFTADKIFAQNPSRTAEDVFRELREANINYDFTDSKNFRGKQKNDSRLTVGFNLDINLQHQITTEWAFRLGLQAVYATLPEPKDKYIPINKTTDQYNSIFNSGGKSSYAAFGLNVGLAYNFFSRSK